MTSEYYNERFLKTANGKQIDLLSSMQRGGVTYRPHVTSDGRGGGMVADSAYVPRTVVVPPGCTVHGMTHVFDTADIGEDVRDIRGYCPGISCVMALGDVDYLLSEAFAYKDGTERAIRSHLGLPNAYRE